MKMGSYAVLAAVLIATASAASASPGVAAVATEAAKQIDAAVGDQRFVMLGEMHGTREAPAISAALLERWTSRDRAKPVLLGLEITSADQPRVDQYIASHGSAADRAALLAGAHWTEPMHDGRDSVAMAGLIERVRAMHASGADIRIVLFDAPGKAERNARMATALRSAMAAHSAAHVLVLTGNVHAMTGEPPEMFNDGMPYKLPTTMARHLADLHPVSIDIRAMNGDYWACQPTCGRQSIAPGGPSITVPSLERSEPGSAWDYRMLLPRFTASEPAVLQESAGRAPQAHARRDRGT